MKQLNRWTVLGVIAASALTSTGRAAEAKTEVNLNSDHPKVEADVKTDRSRYNADGSPHRVVVKEDSDQGIRPENKASHLIGMEIKNNNNEKLGEVKDLVIDLNGGKVSYAVVAVGGILGVGEKLVAVPLSALTPAIDNKLVMNVSKERMAQAPGFAATRWPVVTHGDWEGAKFWNELKTGAGSSATVETGRRTDRNVTVRTDADRPNVSVHTDANANRVAIDNQQTLSGTVKTLDVDNRSLTLRSSDGKTKTFVVNENAALLQSKNPNPTLIDFKPGYPVVITYHNENGKMIVDRLDSTGR